MRYDFDMVEIPASLSNSAARDPTLTASANPKRQRWFELGLVLLIAFLTPIFNSLYFLQRGTAMQWGQGNSRWMFGLIQETICLLLLATFCHAACRVSATSDFPGPCDVSAPGCSWASAHPFPSGSARSYCKFLMRSSTALE